MTKSKIPGLEAFEVVDMGDMLGVTEIGPAPTNEKEEQEALSDHARWPIRPPAYRWPVLPIKNRKTPDKADGGTWTAMLVWRDEKYLFVDRNMFAMTFQDVEDGEEVDPNQLFADGWIGD